MSCFLVYVTLSAYLALETLKLSIPKTSFKQIPKIARQYQNKSECDLLNRFWKDVPTLRCQLYIRLTRHRKKS